jgi:hypothetical protein
MMSSKTVTRLLSQRPSACVSKVRRCTPGAVSRYCWRTVADGTSSCSCHWPETSTSSVSAVGRLQRSSPCAGFSSVMPFTGYPYTRRVLQECDEAGRPLHSDASCPMALLIASISVP